MAKKNKTELREKATRIMCLVLAGLMIASVVLAAALSQVF